MKTKTFGNLKSGDAVLLRHEGDLFPARFVKFLGEGEEKRARFVAMDDEGAPEYEFECYRYHGFWAAGTGATRITVAQ